MNYDHLSDIYEDYLEHYGVKGMKWDPSKKKGKQEDRLISSGGASEKDISAALRSSKNRSKAAEWIREANRPKEIVDTEYGRMSREEYQKRAKISYDAYKATHTDRAKKSQERVNKAMRNLRNFQVKSISGKALDAGNRALASFMGNTVKKKKS